MTAEEIKAAIAVVPMDNGHFQVEWHFGGWDVEIEVDGETGEVLGSLISKA